MKNKSQYFFRNWPQNQYSLQYVLFILNVWAKFLPETVLDFVLRPNISCSLRFGIFPRPDGHQRHFFFLIDIVRSDGILFFSVCFYEDEVNDPKEQGNAIPEGLFMETGYCFDVDYFDNEQIIYLGQRLVEAYHNIYY